MATQVLVVSSSPLAQAGLAAMVEAVAGLALVGSTQPGSAVEIALAREANTVIVHVEPGDDHALDTIARLRAEVPGATIVALVEARTAVDDVLAAGALAALPSNVEAEALAAAIAAAAVGLMVLTRDGLDQLRATEARAAAVDQPVERLTARETEVLQLVAGGHTNQEIARRLGISEHTAKFHVGTVLGKLGARSRAEAVARAAGLGLIVV